MWLNVGQGATTWNLCKILKNAKIIEKGLKVGKNAEK